MVDRQVLIESSIHLKSKAIIRSTTIGSIDVLVDSLLVAHNASSTIVGSVQIATSSRVIASHRTDEAQACVASQTVDDTHMYHV